MVDFAIQILLSGKAIKELQIRELTSTNNTGDPARVQKTLKLVAELDTALKILKEGGYNVDPGQIVAEKV